MASARLLCAGSEPCRQEEYACLGASPSTRLLGPNIFACPQDEPASRSDAEPYSLQGESASRPGANRLPYGPAYLLGAGPEIRLPNLQTTLLRMLENRMCCPSPAPFTDRKYRKLRINIHCGRSPSGRRPHFAEIPARSETDPCVRMPTSARSYPRNCKSPSECGQAPSVG